MTEADAERSPQLVRELGPVDASMIVMGSMIGSGIFITSAESARLVGSPGWLLAAWAIAGLLTITGAICSAEVAAMMPRAGGQYVFLREAYGPAFGFMFGWATFLVVQTGTIAAVAVAFAKFFGILVPEIAADRYPLFEPISLGNSGYAISLSTQQLVAVVLIAFLTAVNTRGLKTGKTIQNTFTFTKTAALIALIVVGLFFGANRGAAAFTSSWWSPEANGWTAEKAQSNLGAVGTLAFLLLLGKAMIGPLFSQTAWNSVTFTGGEIRDPGRTLPRALVFGCGSVVGLYLLANVAYLLTLPFDQIQHAEQDRVGTALMKAVLGPVGVTMMAVAIMISTFGCINGLVLSGARVLYAMARDGLFFRKVATTNRHHVPSVALVAQGLWAILLTLPVKVILDPETGAKTYGNTYNQLLEFLAPVDLTFYMLMVGSVVMFRIKAPQAVRPYRTFAYPVPLVFYLTVAGLLVADFIYLEPLTAGIGYAIALAGIPVYWLRSLTTRTGRPEGESLGTGD
ncbi:APC family permease [Tundrisphaera lichenicola]|uniref:APC family permease n=1 Tax=Tundrisphaera lichenicola TaxID=2029860 RepID=UPI003EB93C16